MLQKWKQIASYLIIIVLMPYVITVFVNGPDMRASSRIKGLNVSVKVKADNREKIIKMPLEEYCIGIMAREIPADYKNSALRAQAVLVRTAVYKKMDGSGEKTELDIPFWSQKQMEENWGAARYSRCYHRLKRAWADTDGKVLMYDRKLVRPAFFRLSNGTTRDGKEVLGRKFPYLKAKDCPADIESEEQIQTVMLDDMDAEVLKCDKAGYVLRVRVGKEEVSGEEFRKTYQLKSSCFTIQKYNGKVRITTRGVGHGIGMSQYMANDMAKKGKNEEDILKYFFEGAKIEEVVDMVTKQ